MELETVLYRVEGNVGIVSLNRTKALNAMSKQIFVDLTTAFDAAEKDDAVRCVIVNAEGRAFCAGGDIPEMKGLDTPEAVFDFYNVAGIFMKKMINFVKPTITVAHGAIAGAGTSLLLAGDIALVADDAMFMVAFGAVGLIPDCAGHWLLPRACGLNMAKELMMTQRAVKAPEMKELGLCNHVYPKDQLMDEAMKLAGIYEKRDAAPYKLSGGQKQRVAIAGVIAMRPDCLVLDESTAMLDPHGRAQVMNTIHQLRAAGITIVSITHYMEEAAQADRVLVMSRGRIVMEGTPEQVFSRTEKLHSYHLDVPQAAELRDALVKVGIPMPENVITPERCAEELFKILR